MPNDEVTISIMLKRRLKYKSPYLLGNIRPNQVMLTLKTL